MATMSKQRLSASTDGRNIKVVATATAGTTIHTAIAGTSDIDEVWLCAVNSDTVPHKVTIEFGGTTAPDDLIEYTVPAEDGLYWIVRGLLLQNSMVVRAFADSANVVMINGFVNRITA